MSIVLGPPGTGKSFVGASIALVLSVMERGHILLTGSSNFAVNGLVEKVTKLKPSNPNVKILRIFSKKRELQMLSSRIDLGPSVDILHEEIRKSEEWLAGDNFDSIRLSNKIIVYF